MTDGLPPFPQTLPANTVVGRLGVSAGPSQAIPFATLASRIGRVKLTANTTYHVPGDFSTVESAIDYLQQSVDGAGYDVTIQIANGTYAVSSVIDPMVGIPILYIKGDTTTPANVLLTPASGFIFQVQRSTPTLIYIQGVTLTYTGCAFGAIGCYQTGNIVLEYCRWVGGAGSNIMVQCTFGNVIFQYTHTIVDTGTTNVLFSVGDNGFLTLEPIATVTFSGTPTVAGVFQAYRGGCLNASGCAFSGGGSVSGFKALLTSGGVIDLLSATGTIPGTAVSNDGSGSLKHPGGAIEDTQWHILASSGVRITAPANTSDNTLVTVSLPANSIGPNGGVKVTAFFTLTNNANAKNLRIKFNGTSYCDDNQASLPGTFVKAGWENRNATNSQVSAFERTYNGLDIKTSAHDTTGALNITITAQKGTGSDDVFLESYIVETMYRT